MTVTLPVGRVEGVRFSSVAQNTSTLLLQNGRRRSVGRLVSSTGDSYGVLESESFARVTNDQFLAAKAKLFVNGFVRFTVEQLQP